MSQTNNPLHEDQEQDKNLITSPRQNISQTELQNGNQDKSLNNELNISDNQKMPTNNTDLKLKKRASIQQQQQRISQYNSRKVLPDDFSKRSAFTKNSQIFSEFITKKETKQKNRILRSFQIHIKNLNSRLFGTLQDKHYLMINDLATIDLVEEKIKLEIQKQRSVLQNCEYALGSFYQQLFSLLEKIWPKVQNPNNPIIQFSTVCEIITIVIILYLFTFYLFYNYQGLEQYFQIKFWAQFVFLICPFIRINCGYYRSGKFIDDRHHILVRYIRAYLFYDLCGNLSILYLQVYQPETWVEKIPVIAVFFKFKTLKSLFRDMQEKLCLTGNKVYMWQMMKLLFITLMLCHVIGTLYHLAAVFQHEVMDEKLTWQHNMGIYDETWEIRYIQSFYWAQSTIMLIGSKGDTTFETIFSCTTIILTVSYFATILSSVEIIMADYNKKTEQYRKETEVLNIFFDQNEQIKKGTQSLLQNYLKYYYVGHKDMTANENVKVILEKFPLPLQEIVKYDRYAYFIKQLTFLKLCFTHHTIEAIPDIVEEEYYMPNQIIFQEEDGINPKLYLVMKGTVKLMNHQGILVGERKQNEYFGEKQFFSNTQNTLSAKSDDFTTILVIDRQKFLNLLQHNEKDLESFHQIQHSFRVTNSSEKIKEKCYKCDGNHIESNCNLVHFTPNKLNLLLKYIHYEQQFERQNNPNQRKLNAQTRHNSWIIRQICDNDTIIIQQNTSLKVYVKPLQQLLKVCQQQDYGSNDEYDEDEEDSDEISDSSSYSDSNTYTQSDQSSKNSPKQQQQQNINTTNNKQTQNKNPLLNLPNQNKFQIKNDSKGLSQSPSFGNIKDHKLTEQTPKLQKLIGEPGSEPEPGSNNGSFDDFDGQFMINNSMQNISEQEENKIHLDKVDDFDNFKDLQNQDNNLIYFQVPNSQKDIQQISIDQPHQQQLQQKLQRQGSKKLLKQRSIQEKPLLNPFSKPDQKRKQSTSKRKLTLSKLQQQDNKKIHKGLDALKQNVFKNQNEQQNIDNKTLKAVNLFKKAVHLQKEQKEKNILGKKELNIIHSLPGQIQKMQDTVLNFQKFQMQNQNQKNSTEQNNKELNDTFKLPNFLQPSQFADSNKQNKNKHKSEQEKDDFEKWQDQNNYIKLKKQKIDAVKNLALNIHSSNYFNLQNMVEEQVYVIEKAQQDEQYKKFFCDFDQYKEFSYFLQHNNLLVILKNYTRYHRKQQILAKKQKKSHSRNPSQSPDISKLNLNISSNIKKDSTFNYQINSGPVTPIPNRQRIQSIMQIGNNWNY